MPIDPLSIVAMAGAAIPGIAELLKQPVAPAFTSKAEYEKASAQYRALDKLRRQMPEGSIQRQTAERQMLELLPSLQQWGQKEERKAFRRERVETALGRLGAAEARGARRITRGLYARGLRGRGEVYRPIQELRREISERRADILKTEAGQEMIERQQQAMAQLQQQYGQWGQETELYGQLGRLGLGAIGEFRPGGAFGGPTTAERQMAAYTQEMRRYRPGGQGQRFPRLTTPTLGAMEYMPRFRR